MHFARSTSTFLLLLASFVKAQYEQTIAARQLTAFNSSFALSSSDVAGANLSCSETESFNNAVNFERSQYAGGPTTEDAFYTIPAGLNHTALLPGQLLKVEDFTVPTNYTIAPNTAISRIMYVSENLNGTVVPVSAYILWPFTARKFKTITPSNSAPAVLWTHPTSGFFGPSAPSKKRDLWGGDRGPFVLAEAGYAVIATDYAGLGVSQGFKGELIRHQYLAMPAAANDAVYAFLAAKEAFAGRLSDQFAVIGQSQGGGVAWGVAELLAKKTGLANGYLGAIAVSPTTVYLSGFGNLIAPFVGFGLQSVFPDFQLADWLTPPGLGKANLLQRIKADLTSAIVLLASATDTARPNFADTWYARAYALLADASRKAIAGPLLVISGTEDVTVPHNVTTQSVADTCQLFPNSQIQYMVSNGTGHVPTLDSSRMHWISWIEDRFSGVQLESKECGATEVLESFVPTEHYQLTWNAIPIWVGAAQWAYQQILAI